MKLLRGKKISREILRNLKKEISTRKVKPRLAVVLVGEDKASRLYIKLKKAAAEKVGIGFTLHKFSGEEGEDAIINKIRDLNNQKDIHGIIVQLPLPGKFNAKRIIRSIDPAKDADGFSAKDKFSPKKFPQPVFPSAIMKLLESAGQNLNNKKAVILANSEIFGKIMAKMLEARKAKPQIIAKSDFNRKFESLRNADIIITAVGKPKMIKGSMIKKNAIIIDGGITRCGRRTIGDIHFDSVKETAGWLSPVPGGVGPVTVACLLENVYKLAVKRK